MDMESSIIVVIICWIISVLSSVLLGLIPFSISRSKGNSKLAWIAWLCTALSGLVLMQVPVLIVFIIVSATSKTGDYTDPVQVNENAASSPRTATMALTCLSGPMKGRTYTIGPEGIKIGRDHDCAIRFDTGTPGISRHHCQLRFEGETLMLTDLESAYGTYLADGQKLPPLYPTQVYVGSRFHLGDQSNLFQVVLSV